MLCESRNRLPAHCKKREGVDWIVKKLVFASLVLVIVLSLSGIGTIAASKTIVIGTIQDLSATNALWGQSQKRGIEMAVEDYNKKGGLLGRQIVLKSYDFKLNVQEGINAYKRLVSEDKAELVLGPPISNLLLALAPITETMKVPIVGEASDTRATSQRPGKPWTYMFASQPTCEDYGATMAAYAMNELKMKKFAVIYNKGNAWASQIAGAFVSYVIANGGDMVAQETFNWTDTDFRAQLTNIKNRTPEGLFVPEYLMQASQITKQARELGMNMTILGPNSFTPPMVELIGAAANNIYFVNNCAFDAPKAIEFTKRFQAKFNDAPTVNAFFGYDNAVIAFEAIKRAKTTDPAKLVKALEETKNVEGLIYNYTFNPTTHRTVEFIPTIIKIENGKYITVGPYQR
ncbi:MAG TPA: hypothetical protein DHD79_07400 [Firmicutes bacterium]|nr:hypothetical protein [Bacillota bacterium]HAZ22648.1 hypothetical protein [Bacillota bacterium]HBG44889.1 hypothetical protein [Bacillota bacterium]HBL49006.1 hypothetical protein [Bacillota bacterium]HBL67802.1 hypothetical protein [Bacillota bacterium]